jgi:hypothetical protein
MNRHLALIALLSLLGSAFIGCTGADTTATKSEEEAFRNPPKEIPPETLKAMQKAREEGMRKADEMRRKAASGG